MDGIQTILKFLTKQKNVIGYSFMALLTAGGEHLFSIIAFRCPCSTENSTYGLVFFLAPAWVLLLIGYFLNSKMWKIFTGCCVNPRKIFPKENSCHFFYVIGEITLSALVAPTMWFSVALLHGTFYECVMSGTKNPHFLKMICRNKSSMCEQELYKVACGKTGLSPADTQELKLILQAQSQILGWFVISMAAFISLIIICNVRCRSKISHLQMKFWKTYAEQEKKQFEQTFQQYAARLSERNIKCFFENKKPDAFPMPTFEAWEAASELFNQTQQHFSTLHRVVEDGQGIITEDIETCLDVADSRAVV